MLSELETCPRSLLVCEKSNFLNEKSRYHTHVAKHYFNYKLSLFIPECGALPEGLASVINNLSPYYLVQDLPVFKLLEEDFLENVVKTGHFYALSYKTRIDEDNTVAFLPSGQMILSLDKDTYEQLGLEGKPSLYSQKQTMRYVVTVNFTDKSMAPGTKQYQRVMVCVKERVPLKCDFLFAKYNTGSDEDRALHCLLSQFPHKEIKPALSSQTKKNLPCPLLNPSDLKGDTQLCEPHEFLDWLGAVNMDISCENSASSFLSTYICPEPQGSVSQALLCTVSGLLIPEDIHALLLQLRRYFDEPKLSSWLSLTVHGFADSPVSWGTMEHGFLKGGENFYNFVCFKNQDYWLQMATGALDGCPP